MSSKKKSNRKKLEVPQSASLEEAKALLRMHSISGVDCPLCNQFVKIYQRQINSTMAEALCYMAKRVIDENGERKFIYVQKWFSELGIAASKNGDFQKLRFWDLIEPGKMTRKDGSEKSGFWRITEKGLSFATGTSGVQKYVAVYNNKRFKEFDLEENSVVYIKDVIAKEFNYSELMST